MNEAQKKLSKADDFTTGTSPRRGEGGLLKIWLVMALQELGLISLAVAQAVVRAVLAGDTRSLAGRELDTGLRVEHFRSLLADLLGDFSDDERAILVEINKDFDRTVEEFLAKSAPAPENGQSPRRDPPGGDVRS